MQDYEIYHAIVPLITTISLVGVIIIAFRLFIKKVKFNILDYILLPIFLLGMYLYIPYNLFVTGFATYNIPKLEKAAKLSIIPWERSQSYHYIAYIYEYLKDGEKAIEYYKKSINGDYKRHRPEIIMLCRLYGVKGDYDNIMRLSKLRPELKLEKYLRDYYILQGEYQKALDTFINDVDESKLHPRINFLKAALYREVGNTKEADRLYKLAEEKIRKNPKSAKSPVEAMLVNNQWAKKYFLESEFADIESFKTVDEYKKLIEADKKELHFK